jgi:hypothetical protein
VQVLANNCSVEASSAPRMTRSPRPSAYAVPASPTCAVGRLTDAGTQATITLVDPDNDEEPWLDRDPTPRLLTICANPSLPPHRARGTADDTQPLRQRGLSLAENARG